MIFHLLIVWNILIFLVLIYLTLLLWISLGHRVLSFTDCLIQFANILLSIFSISFKFLLQVLPAGLGLLHRQNPSVAFLFICVLKHLIIKGVIFLQSLGGFNTQHWSVLAPFCGVEDVMRVKRWCLWTRYFSLFISPIFSGHLWSINWYFFRSKVFFILNIRFFLNIFS